MNTSKQVNIMIGVVLLSILFFGGYMLNESNRQVHATEEINERIAERGARLFVNNCRNCHGLEAEGHIGPALNSGAYLILEEDNEYGLPATPDGQATEIRNYLFNTIACGRTGTFMPMWSQRFGGTLSDTQINQIVTMITGGYWEVLHEIGAEHDEETGQTEEDILADPATLSGVTQKNCGQFNAETAAPFRSRDPFATGTPEPTGTPGGDGGDDLVSQGRQLASSNGCVGCHTVTGVNSTGPTWKGLFGKERQFADGSSTTADEAYITESIKNPTAKVVQGFAPVMPPFASLTDDQIAALIEYIKSVP
ncbi:MAG: c-type cytochrome [Dehalococcoidia bacterium]